MSLKPSNIIMPPAAVVMQPEALDQPDLVIDAADTSSFPAYDSTGWTEMAGVNMQAPCFAWLMRDKAFGNTVPGRGSERLIERVSHLSDIEHPNRIYEAPAHLEELPDEELADYARNNFANMIDRDRMVAIEPDENGRLYVPEGTRPVLLTVFRTRAANPASPQFGRHWYSADQPTSEGGDVPWSHWTADGSPKRFAGASQITNPWRECSFEKPRYQPVSYFLMPAVEQ